MAMYLLSGAILAPRMEVRSSLEPMAGLIDFFYNRSKTLMLHSSEELAQTSGFPLFVRRSLEKQLKDSSSRLAVLAASRRPEADWNHRRKREHQALEEIELPPARSLGRDSSRADRFLKDPAVYFGCHPHRCRFHSTIRFAEVFGRHCSMTSPCRPPAQCSPSVPWPQWSRFLQW